jgi:hypothetical protein
MNAGPNVDYATVLVDLRTTRAKLLKQVSVIDDAIRGIETMLSINGQVAREPTGNVVVSPETGHMNLKGGVGKSTIAVAAEEFLQQNHGVPQKTDSIMTALKAQGFLSDAANPANVVHSTLHRKSDAFARVGRGLWALKSWGLQEAEDESLA